MNQKKSNSLTTTAGKGQFLVYSTEDGEIKIDVRLENETVWLTQADMAKLFQCSNDNISLHLKNIFDEGELQPKATTEDFSVVRKEGIQRSIEYYNLDRIITVARHFH